MGRALGPNAAFMPVKLTALVSPALLERLTALGTLVGGVEQLAEKDRSLLNAALARLGRLCAVARDCGVPLLLDAEQSHRQPAVHLIARELQREFNAGGAVVVYDTLQIYLRAS